MLKLYSGPFGKSEVLHLLRRTMFGVSKADLNFFMGKSLSESIDLIINAPATSPNPPVRTYYNSTDPSKDTFDKINKRELELSSAAIGALIYLLDTNRL